jgi:hypothetical protein
MLSLWSASNSGVWIEESPAEGGTFTIAADASVGPNTGMLNDPRTSRLGVHGDYRSYALLEHADIVLEFITNYGDSVS